MNEMKPTPRLRFIERLMSAKTDTGAGSFTQTGARRILQQWWAPDVPAYMVDPSEGEWRDVPLESET